MKPALASLAAASILIGLPFAAAAHDDDHGRGRGHYKHHGQYARHYYHQAPPVVYYRPAPPPRVVGYPVYVPAPVPVPAPPPRPWPLNQVDIGFRIFF